MPNYQLSKIYKLWSPSKNIIYIGSTTQTLSRRLGKHLSNYKLYKNDNNKPYYTSYLVLECDDYKIELLEEYACNNKEQLLKKEGEYIRNNECVNRCISGRTHKEYNKEWYEKNREAILEKSKEPHKQYRAQHKEYFIEYQKQYREANRDMVNKKRRDAYHKNKELLFI